MVEPIHLIFVRKNAKSRLKEAGYNVFLIKAEDIFIDMLTILRHRRDEQRAVGCSSCAVTSYTQVRARLNV